MPIREDIEKSVKIKVDTIEEKMNNIIDILDNTTYYVATINNLDIPLELFGKMVQQKHASEQIKISREKFNELKKQKYFYSEIPKDESDGKRIIGVEVILKPADVTHHHELERILKQQTTLPTQQSEYIYKFEDVQLKLDRKPSIYQENIFEYIIRLTKNDPIIIQKHMVIEAVAGSGKTWTIEQSTNLVPKNKSYVFLSFNTDIKDEFKRRKPDANAYTFNGAGNTAVKNKLSNSGKIKIFDKNNLNLILDYLFESKYSSFKLEEMDELKPAVKRLVSLYKATGLTRLEERNGTTTVKIDIDSLYHLLEDYDITTEADHTDLKMICEEILNLNFNLFTNNWKSYDYDDQIWLSVIRNDVPVQKYDFVFVDETQDLNKTQLDFAMKVCKPLGSIIAVGDRNQSIYGFRGADTEAIPRIINTLNAKIFPLDITYRCPKSHVNAIKEYARNLPDESYTIEFKEAMEKFEYATLQNSTKEAIEGEVIQLLFDKIADTAKGKDKIICRNNAPLVRIFFQLIILRKNAVIIGKDFGEGLKKLVKKISGNTIKEFRTRLSIWYNKKKNDLLDENKSIDTITDQFECLNMLSEDATDVNDLKETIDAIFDDDVKSDKIMLSTVHKAKGLEVKTVDDSVFVVKSYGGNIIFPSPRATKPKQIKQENNLMYVAYTRGKNKMYIIE